MPYSTAPGLARSLRSSSAEPLRCNWMVVLLRTHASLRPGRACPLQHKRARQRQAAELAVCEGEAGGSRAM